MKPLDLDYAQPSVVTRWWGTALFITGLALLATIGFQYHQLTEEISALEQGNLSLSRYVPRNNVGASPFSGDADLQEELKYINAVVQQLAVSWDELFEMLETSQSRDVALLSLDVDAEKRGRIVITGEARDSSALINYWQRLQTKGVLSGVALRNHNLKPPTQFATRPVEFELDAQWIGWR